MVNKLYVLRDRVSGEYTAPLVVKNNAVMMRELTKDYSKLAYPEDKELYCIGEYDNSIGVINSLDKPEFVVNVADCKPSQVVGD